MRVNGMQDLQQFGQILLNSQRIALAVHVSPDGDAIGSALALAKLLAGSGKEVTIFVDDIIKGFHFLSGVELIKTEKDLDAMVCPLQQDVLCVLDCSDIARIGRVKELVKWGKIINLDHHASNTGFADVTYVDADASATAEVLCQLFEIMGWRMDEDIATCLYVGISTDSGSFKYSNTSGETMRWGGILIDRGVNPAVVNEELEVVTKSTMDQLQQTLPTLTYKLNGKVAYMYIDSAHYDKTVNTDNFVNYCRTIEGVDVAILFKEVESGVVRVSMRSRKSDLAPVAVGFGGGGHHHAAGCTLNLPLPEAIDKVLDCLSMTIT